MKNGGEAEAEDDTELDIEVFADVHAEDLDIDVFDLFPKNGSKLARFRDKCFFVLGVVNVLILAYLTGKYPQVSIWNLCGLNGYADIILNSPDQARVVLLG